MFISPKIKADTSLDRKEAYDLIIMLKVNIQISSLLRKTCWQQ